MPATWDAIIIGGGAAGYFGAIHCAEAGAGQLDVLILEKSSRVLQKVKISGGGRCNVTHDCLDPKRMASHYPRGNKALIGPLHRFGVRDTIRWFTERGVELKTESDGRMFPTTDDSQTIIDCLRDAADSAGARLRTRAAVQNIERGDDAFELALHNGEQLRARRILVATGGARVTGAAKLAEDLGHELAPAVPSLFTFNIDDPRIEGLQGLSVDPAQISVRDEDLTDAGPLLITHWGMSGPSVLKLSAWGARELHARGYDFTIDVNWLAGVDVEQRFHDLRSEWGKRQIVTHSPFGAIPMRLWERLVEQTDIDARCRWAEFPKASSQKLAEQLTCGEFQVTGKSTYKDEFVTCGGVATDDVDMTTMESRQTSGAHFAGEILDIDGVTGGFNFQNAWTTGFLAGSAIADGLRD